MRHFQFHQFLQRFFHSWEQCKQYVALALEVISEVSWTDTQMLCDAHCRDTMKTVFIKQLQARIKDAINGSDLDGIFCHEVSF